MKSDITSLILYISSIIIYSVDGNKHDGQYVRVIVEVVIDLPDVRGVCIERVLVNETVSRPAR